MAHTHDESNYFAASVGSRSHAQIILEGCFLCALDAVGVLGNILVCLVVYQRRNFTRVANIYVVALAFSDILMSSVCEPLSVAFLFQGAWTFGETACRLQGCLSFFAAFFSLQTMTAMAVNRYFRVVKPHLYRKLFSVWRTLASLVIIACTSLFGAGISTATGLSDFTIDYGKSFCFIVFPTPVGEKTFIVLMHFFYVAIPLSVVSVCYYKIFKKVRMHKATFKKKLRQPLGEDSNPACPAAGPKNLPRRQSHTSASLNVEEVRISKVLFATVLGFTLCWTPIALVDLIDVFTNHSLAIPRQVFLMYAFLGYGSSSINPFIYSIMNREFRLDLLNLFSCVGGQIPRPLPRRVHTQSNKAKSDSSAKQAEAAV